MGNWQYLIRQQLLETGEKLNMKLQHSFVFGLVVIAIPSFSGCGTIPEKSGLSTITGEVMYHESVTLPPDTQITVSLEDVSGNDIASGVMVITEFKPVDSPPYKFSLEYNTDWINPDGRYAIRARIDVDGKLMFYGTEYINAREKSKKKSIQVKVDQVDPVN